MKYCACIWSVCLFFFCIEISIISCNPKQVAKEEGKSDNFYQQAAVKLREGDTSSVFKLLAKTFTVEEIQTMQIVQGSNFQILINNQFTRPKLRGLVKEYSEHSFAQMVNDLGPGHWIEITGQIKDEDDL